MPDTGGVGGFHMPGSTEGPKGPAQTGPTGESTSDFKGPGLSTLAKKYNLSDSQVNDIQNIRSQNGFSGKISPLEEWFMDHSQGDPIQGITMYVRFMNSMMMTCVTTMSSVAKETLERQKQQDRQSYGGMA